MQHIQHNHLKRCREEAGLSKTKLARKSEISVNTIRDIEEHRRPGNPVTRHRLVHALNQENLSSIKYTFEDVFPK